MRHRRLVLATVVLAVMAIWLIWHPFSDLSERQQLVVGRWYSRVRPNESWPGGAIMIHDYGPNRSVRIHAIDGRTGTDHVGPDGQPTGIHGRWRMENDDLIVDWHHDRDPDFVSRVRRSLPPVIPGALPPKQGVDRIERLSDEELITRHRFGDVFRRTRVPPTDDEWRRSAD